MLGDIGLALKVTGTLYELASILGNRICTFWAKKFSLLGLQLDALFDQRTVPPMAYETRTKNTKNPARVK